MRLDERIPNLSQVSPNSGSRIWHNILKNLTNGILNSYDVTSYLMPDWSIFFGILHHILKLELDETGLRSQNWNWITFHHIFGQKMVKTWQIGYFASATRWLFRQRKCVILNNVWSVWSTTCFLIALVLRQFVIISKQCYYKIITFQIQRNRLQFIELWHH